MAPARRRAAATLALAGVLALPAAAAAIPFGANLNRPANSTIDCTIIPVGAFGLPSNSPTCTYAATGHLGDFSEGFNVPAGRGVITAVSVRVGPVTGPMQIVIFRSLRDPLSTAPPVCCKVVGLSPVFTPAPNAVTTLQTNFAVRNDRVPEPGLDAVEFDTMALSVLAPGVPVPANQTGITDPLQAPGGLGFFPALATLGEERVNPAGTAGFQILMAGEWVPTATATPPAPPGAQPAVIRLVRPVVSISGPTLSLGLRCTQATPCAGIFRLQSQRAGQAGAQAAAARAVTYASGRFRIGAGRSGTLKAKLNKAGRALAAKKGTVRAWANITLGGRVVTSTRVTLRRP